MPARSLLPLSGALGVVLIFGSFVPAGSPPGASAPVGEVVSFYTRHDVGQVAAGALMSVGALLFLLFAATVAGFVRDGETETDVFALLCLSGGVLVTAGLALFAGLGLALGEVADHVGPATLRPLHVLSQELVFPLTLGTAAFLLGAGIAAVRSRVLATWLNWSAIGLGLVAAVPSHVLGGVLDHIGFIAFVGLGIWTLVVSVLLATRQRRPSPA